MKKTQAKQFIKISARNIGEKLIAFAFVLAILPLNTFNIKPDTYKTMANFDENSPQILTLTDKKVSIQIGISNDEIARKPQLLNSTAVRYPDAKAHRDPMEFRPIYMDAAKEFNIPWQLIEAVHEVESGKSGSTDKRSYAGATGPMQFMPGTWRAYAIDGNKDGSADITDVTDSIYTAAHYLARSGADEGRYDDALFNYNHSTSYVNKVKGIAIEIGL